MPANYVLLERIELNASAASVTFANIPQSGYTDLKIVLSARTTYADQYDGLTFTFNGSTANFSTRQLYGTGSTAASNSSSSNGGPLINANTSTSNTFGNAEVYIPNYTSSNFKSVSSDGVTENNATQAFGGFIATLWSNTAAITSITLGSANSSSFLANSTFSLYGLAATGTTPVIAPKATGGNRIDNDGTYWYHTYTSTGSFVPLQGLSCDVLVVAGGGGAGNNSGSGGGAGGLLGFSAQSLTTGNYSVTIGAGGVGSNDSSLIDTRGNASTFQGLTATVGGGGGLGRNNSTGTYINGGSGAGATSGGGQQNNVGLATSGQGNNGGTATNAASQYGSGGGGGAGGVGGNGTSSVGGAGGVGSTTYSSWGLATSTGQNVSGTVYYAGGGAGGGQTTSGNAAGGYGGGGSSNSTGVAGTVNTGGGGGASVYPTTGGAGGSGIVIIRYPIA